MYVQSDVPFWRVLMRIAVLLSLAFLGCASLLTATAAPPTFSVSTIENASTTKAGMPPMIPDVKTWKIKGTGGFTAQENNTQAIATVSIRRRFPIAGSNPQAYEYTTVNPNGTSPSGSLQTYTSGSGLTTIAWTWELGSAAVPGAPPAGAGDTYRTHTHVTYKLLGEQVETDKYNASTDFVFP